MLDSDQTFAHAFYKDAEHAGSAVRKLLDASFDADHVGVLMIRGSEVEELPMRHKTLVPHGAVLGALVGAAAGALTLSGIGVVAAGPLFIALQGAAAGGALGTLTGTLGGLGFWREEVNFPTDAFEQGAVLVGVVTNPGRADEARRVLASAGASDTYVSTKAEAVESVLAHRHSVPSASPEMKAQRDATRTADR